MSLALLLQNWMLALLMLLLHCGRARDDVPGECGWNGKTTATKNAIP